ncbi:hypothetical protein F0Q45_25365 [Mycobacterium simiae]|uniref:Uncharacterized protein n=1 Tax=Mycobacterium simiae TaxID=1784 RepID=A0A5B1B972_MYCSI|nr:hypothetical protein [Mycobacterium simiae]KAA1243814.1 hypothetical protein F0Q45_25365 [Mycobacterium simiae]
MGTAPAESGGLRQNGAKAAATNVPYYLGNTDESATLSGEGHCFIDTGDHNSAMSKGDFFALPNPA